MKGALIIAICAAILLLPFVSVTQTRTKMDAVTGSTEWQTTWPFGITAGPHVNESPLEIRLKKMGVRWKRDWRLMGNTSRTLLGNATRYECGRAPPILTLLPIVVDTSTDEELLAFVHVMQSGTEAEQRKAIDEAINRAMRR